MPAAGQTLSRLVVDGSGDGYVFGVEASAMVADRLWLRMLAVLVVVVSPTLLPLPLPCLSSASKQPITSVPNPPLSLHVSSRVPAVMSYPHSLLSSTASFVFFVLPRLKTSF